MMKFKSWKTLLLLCVLIGTSMAALGFFEAQFRLANIQVSGLAESEQALDQHQQQVLEGIIDQPFAYLDRGKQSFVFISQDRRYVLKFFDVHCLKGGLSSVFSPPVVKYCERRLDSLRNGYRLAFERDRAHTGLIFVQLLPNPKLSLKVDLIDRFGWRHTIDLGSVPFVIQQKAIPTRVMLTALLDKGEVAEAKRRLRQIIDLYIEEYHIGIYDRDHNFMYNTGFIDESPIRIDVGRLRADARIHEPTVFLQDLRKIALHRTGEWMQRHFPAYRDEILADMEAKLREVVETGNNLP